MNDLVLPIYYIVIGSAMMLALLGLTAAAIIPGIDRWNRRFFIVYFSNLVLYTIIGTVDLITFNRPGMTVMQEVISSLETLISSLLPPLMMIYLFHCCGEKWQKSPLFRAVAAMWAAYFVIMCIAPFTSLFYYYTPDNQFHRGPLYSLVLILVAAIHILILAGVIRRRNKLSRIYYHSILIGFLPMTIAVFIHFSVSAFMLYAIGVVICAISMFFLILSAQVEQYMRQQREIAYQRANIMILQMRPHFIYNTMMSIYYLCKQDPDLAQQVTLDFTSYLRRNFTAIAAEELIPFPEELEHTRAYLAVEQAQFEDSLFVEYDTPYVNFRMPPLTLQPIVENAVKHGMDPDSAPLLITIRTRSTGSGSEIIVENTGADFEPADDSAPYTALENIQQRLEMMCRGKMAITARKGGGTVVTVTIPS